MLGSQIEDQLLGLEALVLDDRKLDAGAFADLAKLGVGGGQWLSAFCDLLAESEHALGERLGTRRAAWHVNVDRDDRVDALEGRIAVPELPTR
jgi:hypothetical protein